MRYLIGFGIVVIWSAFVFYKGYDYCSDQVQIKQLKAKVYALKRLADSQQAALKNAREEENTDNQIEGSNEGIIDEVRRAIENSNDNPECSSSSFMQRLRDLR